tara:strand:+ start:742 stop:885 length:144 start_codon:yes stop_codon:yes gene_type:complete
MYETFKFTEREYIRWVEKMNKSYKTKAIIRYNPYNYLKEKNEKKEVV